MLEDITKYIREHPLEILVVVLAILAILLSLRSSRQIVLTLQEGVIL